MNKEREENGLRDLISGLIGDATKNLSVDQKELLASGILKLIGEWIRADVTERGGVLDRGVEQLLADIKRQRREKAA